MDTPKFLDIEVLLVEDNSDDVELTLHAFNKNNFGNKIHICRDGEEALDFINQVTAENEKSKIPKRKINLILLDLKLPKVDGLEVLKKIKADPKTKSISVVILTSSKEQRDLVESYQLGVNSYIQKPVDFEKFIEAVRQLGLYWFLLNRLPNKS